MKITSKKLYHGISAYRFDDALDSRSKKQRQTGRRYRKRLVRLLNKRIRKMNI